MQSSGEARALAERVTALVRGKTLGPDLAVQVALLNNKGLQAAYADVGMSSAELWQESLLVNPRVSVGIMGINAGRTVETAVVSNILALATRPRRMAVADARFRQAQLRAAEATLRLAADTRRAWIDVVAAWETGRLPQPGPGRRRRRVGAGRENSDRRERSRRLGRPASTSSTPNWRVRRPKPGCRLGWPRRR